MILDAFSKTELMRLQLYLFICQMFKVVLSCKVHTCVSSVEVLI